MKCRKLLLPAVFLLSLSAWAQFKAAGLGNLRVLVVYTDDRAVTTHARVQLMSSASNNPIGEEFTNDLGEVEFYGIDEGDYHVVVMGEGIRDADSGIIQVDGRKGSQSISITVKRTEEGTHTAKAATASVSVNQLKIPHDAKSKFDEAKGFGANHVVSSKDSAAIKKLGGSFDLLISTVNVKLDWDAMIGTLAPNGRLHFVGAVLEPIPVAAFSLIGQQRSVSGSPTGSPVAIETMLDFASRHNVTPQTEHFPMSRINEAFERLEAGKARYRIVLDADF